ncbi:protein ypfJ [Bibersteinia trehalosi USDA-ARS-USMARC-188]|uniref:Protein ypfJ n=2 Tax=Bibersteinia trehalosi TaxID=47735 RepID=A0A4V7I9Y3_BIBTR|nr:neutral zinc metallopeptidase [Bibersteinia trehalosi]AGH38373.1 protein ypfJ [Bibersteinia trehalosi USDA-ARS-USMARC-192]AHG81828.1 protein ypfJ [Bibersteinia trehalosi USDA-ARS-USMARC-188]AHG84120.1 protein ypfJ [Bibersteinia trehalosi USDA-ARS-USMARC-189]
MRLDGQRESNNVIDRRKSRSGGSFVSGRKKGGILSLLIVLVGAYYGVDLSGIVGLGNDVSYQQTSNSRLSQAEEEHLEKLSRQVLGNMEDTWGNYFRQNGMSYRQPKLVLYTGVEATACGTGQAAMGPFYCPADERIYIDLSFYDDMRSKMRAGGDFAFSYVIAHEVGHHIQNQLGISQQTQQAQRNARSKAEANKISVMVELQADCFAGVWGHQIQKEGRLDEGDVEEAFVAAQAVGDDRLQQQSTGRIIPDSFTHGSSKQRLEWFRKGLYSGNPSVCNTFAAY